MLRCFVLILALCLLGESASAAEGKVNIFQGAQNSPLSLSAIMIAVLEQPDFIELPLMLTKDDIPVVYDDVFLHSKTDVAEIFPARKRQDGMYYFADFLWSEIRQLSFQSRIRGENFTEHLTGFDDVARIVRILSEDQGREVQILPLIKYPWFYANEGKDISAIVVQKVIAHAETAENVIYLKCYDPDELQRIRKTILPGLPVEVQLIQGIDVENGGETMRKTGGRWNSYNYSWMFTRLGVRVLSGYAYGLSLASLTVAGEEPLAQTIEDSHGLGLKVFVSMDPGQSPTSLDVQLENVLFTMNVDGVALASPSQLRKFLLERDGSEGGMMKLGGETAGKTGAAAILSDPETLSRRLKEIQESTE